MDDTQKIVTACVGIGRHQPHQLLAWLVADVLAGFGVQCEAAAPADMHAWLADVSGQYARAVAARPFGDVLGEVYQSLASRGHCGHMGQFFTPSAIAELMNRMLAPFALPDSQPGRFLRMCEPACGSGAQVLAFLRTVMEAKGGGALRHWSLTAIDLDHLCANICAAQVLANLCIGRLELGELVVYRGNALGRVEDLGVVVHATTRDQTPDVVLPALHPSRLHALRRAAGPAAPPEADRTDNNLAPVLAAAASTTPAPAHAVRRTQPPPAVEAAQVDLFAD